MVDNSPSETRDQSWEVTVTVYTVPDIVTVTHLIPRATLAQYSLLTTTTYHYNI